MLQDQMVQNLQTYEFRAMIATQQNNVQRITPIPHTAHGIKIRTKQQN